jgi:NAD(P)-dependent dehydrogenase (short-subunit alcohol dehydrogenase family)/acyl carrier protein
MAQDPADSTVLLAALQAAQTQLEALQSMQQQTAEIHRRFLEGQQASQASFQSLIDGQQRLLEAALTGSVPVGAAVLPPAPRTASAPADAPSPAAVAHQPVVSAPAPVPSAPAPAIPAAPSTDPTPRIVPILLQVVAESTGYPTEMLELDMDLESDLGIDSIKRVEILSLFTERMPEAPAVEPEALGRLHTLRQVADFVAAGIPTAGGIAEPPSVPSAAPVASVDPTPVLLQVVSELTGYPVEMLDLDQDLESDLGIDSIKRVEILSLLTERLPGAPAVEPEALGRLHTLRQVVTFLGDADVAPQSAAPAPTQVAPTPSVDAASVLLQVVSDLTGYPAEMLDLDQDLESDLGIDSIKRVEILSLLSERLPGAPVVEPENLGGLHTLRQVLRFLSASPAAPMPVDVAVEAPTDPVARRAVVPRLVGSLPAGDGALAIASGREVWIVDDGTELVAALATRFEAAGHTVRCVERSENNGGLPEGPCGALLLLDGHDGVGEPWADESEAALKDAFALVRALAPRLRSAGEAGGAILASVTRLDGELGHAGTGSDPLQLGLAGLIKTAAREWPEVRAVVLDVAPGLDSGAAAQAVHGALLDSSTTEVGLRVDGLVVLDLVASEPAPSTALPAAGSLAVVTGGARGVTAACVIALARKLPLHFLLLGRSPMPDDEPSWLAPAEDEAAVKRALMQNAFPDGRPSPRALGAASVRVLADREIRGTIAALQATGSTVDYRSVDARDPASVSVAIDQARAQAGPVRVLVHGAGVLRDRRIEEKTAEEFDAVFDTKVGGLKALLTALAGDEPAAVALFTSVSGRFGRRGQVDYAMANEALVGVGASLRARWPASRVVAFDWGPWEGGMVTSALAAQFRREGVGLIPLQGGADAFVRDLLASPGEPVELVVGSGLDPAPAVVGTPLVEPFVVDPSWPVLGDHRLNGRPVLPAALVVEAFVGAVERASGAQVISLDRLRVLRGVSAEASVELSIEVTPSGPGVWELSLRDADGRARYTAAATTGRRSAGVAPSASITDLRPWTLGAEETRRTRLFHGPLLAAINAVAGVNEAGIVASLSPAGPPDAWISGRTEPWSVDPLVLDGIFQAAILWCEEELGAPSLPSSFDRLILHQPDAFGPVEVRLFVRASGRGSVRADVELVDADGALVARMEGYRATASASLYEAFGLSAPTETSEAAVR